MRITAAFLSALAAVCTASGAGAGPIADAGLRAETLQAEGKAVEALDALNEAIDQVWTEAPLAFRKTLLVESPAGYGNHTERRNRVFRPDETMLVYLEPVGFGYGTSEKGATIDFKIDLSVETATGQVIVDANDLLTFSTEIHPNRRDFGLTLKVTAPYYRPGDYKAIFTVRDQNSPKSASFEVPFTLATPAAAETAAPAPAAPSAASTPEAAPAGEASMPEGGSAAAAPGATGSDEPDAAASDQSDAGEAPSGSAAPAASTAGAPEAQAGAEPEGAAESAGETPTPPGTEEQTGAGG